ncbi:MAG: class I SAM-dependent methyltransferase family protein [Candidatus Thorarchaeota archaeon]
MSQMGTKNKKKINYLKLKKKDGQELIKIIKTKFNNQEIINLKFRILHEKEDILFPIYNDQDFLDYIKEIFANKIKFEIVYKEGIPNLNYKVRSLQEALKGKILDNHIDLIPKSYDIIGDIVIIEFNRFNNLNRGIAFDYKRKIAVAIMKVNRNVKTVLEKRSEVKGPCRLRDLAFLAGEDKSETIHRENDCLFKLDVKKTYFSPRLVFERQRVALSSIKENELIVDMFAGVGTFSIQIAKINNVKIHAFDVNPNAYNYIKKNIKLNRLRGDIYPVNIDVENLIEDDNQLGKMLFHKADRIIMNLPESSIKFVDIACFLIKESGGIMHFYQFTEKPNPIEKTLKNLEAVLALYEWQIDSLLESKIVKHFSPRSELVVLDLKIIASK